MKPDPQTKPVKNWKAVYAAVLAEPRPMKPDPQTEPVKNWKAVYAAVLAWLVVMIVGMRWLMEHYS